MKRLAFIIKNILKFWWWQDIEKSNIFIRAMNRKRKYILYISKYFSIFFYYYISCLYTKEL